MRSLLYVSLLAAALPLLIAGMYEDEQGMKDWYLAGVGPVSRAGFQPKVTSTGRKMVYVLSDTSTIAALRKGTGAILWRNVFSKEDPLICIVPKQKAVAVVSESGIVSYISEGIVLHTFALPISGKVLDCALGESDNIIVASLQSTTLTLISTDWESEFSKQQEVQLNFSPLFVRAGMGKFWIQLQNQTVAVVNWDDSAPKHFAGGTLLDVSAHSVLTLTGNVFVMNTKCSKPQCVKSVTLADIPLKNVGAAILRSTAEPEEEDIVVHGRDAIGKLVVHVGKDRLYTSDFNVHPFIPSTVVAACQTKRTEILICTSDGHLHFVTNAVKLWSRPEGLSTIVLVDFSDPPPLFQGISKLHIERDKFGFSRFILLASAQGRLFNVWTKNGTILWDVDIFADAIEAFNLDFEAAVELKPFDLRASPDFTEVTLLDKSDALTLHYETATGIRLAFTKKIEHVIGTASSHFLISQYGNVHLDTEPTAPVFLHTVDKNAGVLRGYTVQGKATEAVRTWTVDIGTPLTAVATADSGASSTADFIRYFPNRTSKTTEILTKYTTKNTIFTAHFRHDQRSEKSWLVLTAIDGVSGSVLGSTSHSDVEGDVKMLVAENILVYHFLNVKHQRYYLGVWEMFEHSETTVPEAASVNPAHVAASLFSKQRRFSSLSAPPPRIVPLLLLFPTDISVIGITTSREGIARKMILFGSKGGSLYGIDLRNISHGFDIEGFPRAVTFAHPQQVLVHSTQIMSYKYTIHNMRSIKVSPTLLESTCHVLAVGQDLFYIRASPGKPFDVLNHDFNFRGLLILVGGLSVLTVVASFFARRKILSMQWA